MASSYLPPITLWHKYALAALLSLTIMCIGAAHASAYSKQATFTQRILPLNCVFQTVNDGTGTLYFVTPAACGVIIPPPSSGGQTPTGQSLGPQTNLSSGTQGGPLANASSIILLNDFYQYRSGAGVSLYLPLNQIVYFDVSLATHSTERHSITVNQIGKNYVILTLASKPITARLVIGQTGQYDVTGNHDYDIAVSLVSISHDEANLVFRPVRAQSAASTPQPASTQNHNYLWVGLAALTITVASVTIAVVYVAKK